MKYLHLPVFLILVAAVTVFAGERQNNNVTITPVNCGDGFSCERVAGNSNGNHELDCTVVLPGALKSGHIYPVIAWANDWEQGNVLDQCVTGGYMAGLKNWAVPGSYIVVAANAWGVNEDGSTMTC